MNSNSHVTASNINTLWARALIDELAAAGVDGVCVAPGSRSTPLTVAVAQHDELRLFTHLDERSAAFFAVGRSRVTGTPTAIVTTSGTATAELHPAIMEASQARVPLIALTADRPRELQDSGANQTADQTKLYGDAVKWFRELADPEADARKLRSLRTTAARAVADAKRTPAGPIHLNVPFRKPLEPTIETEAIPANFTDEFPLAAKGRDGAFVRIHDGHRHLSDRDRSRLAEMVTSVDRPLLVAGPGDGDALSVSGAKKLLDALDAPLIADPLSGLRYGPHISNRPIIGSADVLAAADVVDTWPSPDLVIRFGASPTSKSLRQYLADVEARQVLVDPAGGWREATFTATDVVAAAPDRVADCLAKAATTGSSQWRERWTEAANVAQSIAADSPYFEGGIARTVVAEAPEDSTLFVSNSMPVRDIDRFGLPRSKSLAVYGNRGVSGIDGIASSAFGVGSVTDGPLIVLTGDLAYIHDMNGLLASEKYDIAATIVLINNDGGGIFHRLPIADHETFENQFRTPHGLDFAPTGDLYNLEVTRVNDMHAFETAYESALFQDGTHVIEAIVDSAESHTIRDRLESKVGARLSGR